MYSKLYTKDRSHHTYSLYIDSNDEPLERNAVAEWMEGPLMIRHLPTLRDSMRIKLNSIMSIWHYNTQYSRYGASCIVRGLHMKLFVDYNMVKNRYHFLLKYAAKQLYVDGFVDDKTLIERSKK